MTDKQINILSNCELLEQYKHKQLCVHSDNTTIKLLREIHKRNIPMKIGFYSVSTAVNHLFTEGKTPENINYFVDLLDQIIHNEKIKFC